LWGIGSRCSFLKEFKLKMVRDIDYAEYALGFRDTHTKPSAWLTGIYGPSASSGQPSRLMMEQNVFSRRTWTFRDVEGVDIRGSTNSGNFWRYVGTYGEAIDYFDVSREAADYFDKFLDTLCYDPRGGTGLE
jgi:hypothetical protein